jgi:hypothetical protein
LLAFIRDGKKRHYRKNEGPALYVAENQPEPRKATLEELALQSKPHDFLRKRPEVKREEKSKHEDSSRFATGAYDFRLFLV